MRECGKGLEAEAVDRYKSEGERQIARLLDKCGIEYRYEYPLAVVDRGKLRIWYPDFQLAESGIIIECVGMRNNEEYNSRLDHKRKVYAETGLPVIFVGQESFQGYWPRKVMESVERTLEERLRTFRRQAKKGSS